MNFARDSFLRCYLDAWTLWLPGNMIMGWFQYFRAKYAQEPVPRPFGFVENLAEPGFLIANALLCVLFAGVIIGLRRPTGISK